MKNIQKIHRTFRSRPTLEGAGVLLKRAFGYSQVPLFDPFLLLDDFHSSNPENYLAGFPWHPHRGIERHLYKAPMISGGQLAACGRLTADKLFEIASEM